MRDTEFRQAMLAHEEQLIKEKGGKFYHPISGSSNVLVLDSNAEVLFICKLGRAKELGLKSWD
jgi:hypothetical protein